MILGLGNDLCDIRRIEQSLDRFGDRFIERVFTEGERLAVETRSSTDAARAAAYAKRFAAKEACSKALGTGMRDGVAWRCMEVSALPSGKPVLTLSGGALVQAESLMPNGHQPRMHLTLTDDYPWAQAVVILEALPNP